MKMWVRAQRAMFDLGISILPMGQGCDGSTSYVSNIVYDTVEKGTSVPHSPIGITLDSDAAKMLMDDLWIAGVRPSENLYGSTDKDDIRFHLEDMRRIVFNGIKISMEQSKNSKE